jgi:hypothetical protein
MDKRFFKFCLVFSFCLLNWSCSLFHPKSLERDSEGYLVNHYWSCGPAALQKAFEKLNLNLSREEVSREIQDSGNTIRLLLSLAHHETIQMTLPSEIERVIKDHGFKVINIREFGLLNTGVDVAIVLVSGNYLKGETHWLCFPIDSNIEKYFGKNTRIRQIFLLKNID